MRPLLPILVDVLTFASLVLLGVPAWHINHYAKLASRLAQLRLQLKFEPMAERHRQLKEKMNQLRDEWKPWKAWCLFAGTVAGAAAALFSLIDHWLTYHASATPG